MKLAGLTLAALLTVPSLAWADGPDDDGRWTDDETEAETDTRTETAPEEASPPPAAEATTRAATAVAPGMVRLFIESPRRVSVYETHGRNEVGRKVCESPCGKVVDGSRGERFIVKGKGVGASSSFDLEGLRGDTRLVVDPGSRGRKAGGIVMTVFGGIGTAAGLLLAGYAIFDRHADEDRQVAAAGLGGASFAVGAGLLAGGIALIVTAKTQVEVVPNGRAPSVEPEDEDVRDARSRERRPDYLRGEF